MSDHFFVSRIKRLINAFLLVSILAIILALVSFLVIDIWHIDNPKREKSQPSFSTNFSYLIDDSSKLSVDDIINTPEQFTRSLSNKIPYELGKNVYWVKVTIVNKLATKKRLVLHADTPIITKFDAYVVENNNIFEQLNSDLSTPIQKTFPNIPLTLPANSTKVILLALQSYGLTNIPLSVYDVADFDNRVQLSLGIYGSFIGVIMIMCVYNLVLFAAIKDNVYLVYIGYLLSSFFVLATINGFGHYIFPTNIQTWVNQNTLLFHHCVALFLVSFAMIFLRYHVSRGILYTLGKSLCIAIIALYFIDINFSETIQARVFFLLQALVYFYCIYLLFNRLKEDYSWAKFYFISWIPLTIGATIQPLMLFNIIDNSFFARNAFLLGVMVEICFMALALAERMRRNEQDQLHHLCYHSQTGLPRQLNLENKIKHLTTTITSNQDLIIIVLKPEHIEKIKHYVDDEHLLQLFKNINNKLSVLFKHNDAVIPLTINDEKLCYINGKCLGYMVDISKLSIPIESFIQSVQQVITETYNIKGLTLSLTGVMGIAHYPNHGLTSRDLVKHALVAINEADNTPEKWAVYHTNTTDKSTFLLELASDIQEALKHNIFEIHHQPQIDLKTSKVCGSECLIRWNHPTKGYIPPGIFIPVAEDMGLINLITLWVIKQSLYQHLTIMQNKEYNHMVSINISGIDIISKNFYKQAIDLINESGVPSEKIIFEITESANIAKNEHAVNVIEKLTDFGITVSIDDFGTGYSSLANLDKLPFQELKIDKQFVENVHLETKRKIITETTVKMAKGVGLEVVAEGIASKLDEETLTAYGCDIGQGYYYSEAMPIQEYLEWLSIQQNGKTPINFYGEYLPVEKDIN